MHDLTVSQLLWVWVGVTLIIVTGLAAALAVGAVAWAVLDLLV
jgi:hypothetical protein